MTLTARIVAILWGTMILTACDQHAMLERFTSPAEQATAKTFIDQLRSHHFDEIEKAADASIAGPSLDGTLDKMAAVFPSDPPISVTLVGAHRISSTSSGDVVTLTFEYHFPQRYLIVSLATKRQNGRVSIIGCHVQPETQSLESLNRFTWSGKGALRYSVLAYGIAAPLFTLAVLVICGRTKINRRKWLWILFIAFGVGQFSVNWTTGHWRLHFFAVELFSAGAHAELFGPWILSVSLPLGAMVFLLRRSKLGAMREAPPA